MTHAPTPAASRTAWVIFTIASAAYFVAVIQRTALGVASVQAADRFGIEATALAMLAVVQIAVYAGMQVPAGTLLDRFGPATVIVAGSAVMAAGQALMAVAPGFWWALAARALIGAGDAPVFIAVTKIVAQHFPPRRVPVMVQLTGLIGQTGQLATAIPLAFLLHTAGWTTGFSTLAALGTVAAIAVFLVLVRPTLGTRAAGAGTSSVADALKTHWRTPGVRLGFWSHFLGPFSANTIALLWGVPYFTTAQGRTPAEASSLLTVMVIANIAIGPVIGALTARYPMRRSWLVLGAAVVTALAWAMVLVPTSPRPFWVLAAFVAVVGAGGPMSLIGMDFARSFAVQHKAGSANGFVNMGGFIATIISVLVVGVVLQVVSPAGATTYTLGEFRLAFAALIIPWLMGVIGVILSRRETRAVMAAEGTVVPTLGDIWRRFRER